MSAPPDTELLKFFYDGFNHLYGNEPDPGYAKRRFEYCLSLSATYPQADLYRAIAACERDSQATTTQLRAIYANVATFGELTRQLFRAYYPAQGTDSDFGIYPRVKFTPGLFGIEFKITTVSDVHACIAIAETMEGNFVAAKSAINSSPVKTVALHAAEALMYYRAGRWVDTINAATADELRLAAILDDYDRPVIDAGQAVANVLYQSLALLLSGTAYAHLGETATAKKHLELISAGNYTRIASEANRIYGLLERAAGHEESAQKFFADARSLYDSDDLRAVTSDRRAVLTVTNEEMIGRRTSYWDVSTEPSLAKVLQSQRDSAKSGLLAEADSELARQIGMSSVKAEVEQLRAEIRINQEMKRRGFDVPSSSNHLIFLGPPGTGKTTVARVVAKIYAGLGVARTDQILETSRKDFIGTVEGETAKKTQDILSRALGGVLFIDEAYDLIQERNGHPDPYGQEAVNVLLTEMENHRDDLIVIIAGYEKDLRRFLNTNEGLNSRFSRRIQFKTYSPTELANIAEVVADSRHQILTPAAKAAISDIIQRRMVNVENSAGRGLIDVAGNGRFVRNIVESSERNKAVRLSMVDIAQLTDEDFRGLTEDDVVSAVNALIEGVR